MIGKSKLIHSTLPHKIFINKNVIFEEKRLANAANNFFIDVGSELTDNIQDFLKATSKKLIKQ